jgi:hypothetical protein
LPAYTKLGVLTILFIWGLGSLVQGWRLLLLNIPGRLEMLGTPVIARAFVWEVLVFPFGLSLAVLITDYVIAGKFVKRHKIELLATVIIGALGRVARPLFDIVFWLRGGLSWTRLAIWASWPQSMVDSVIVNGYVIILVILCAYFAKRVLTNKSLLSKRMFSLTGASYLWLGAEMIWSVLIHPSLDPVPSPLFTGAWYTQVSKILEIGANLIFALFLTSIYLRLRHTDHVEVSAPSYIRGYFLLYGVFSAFYHVVSYQKNQASAYWDYPWLTAASIIADLAIALVAVYPPSLTVSEDVT